MMRQDAPGTVELQRQLHQERQARETLVFQLQNAAPADVTPELTVLPTDATPYVGKIVRVRSAPGEPTSVHIGVTTSAGGAAWIGLGQSD